MIDFNLIIILVWCLFGGIGYLIEYMRNKRYGYDEFYYIDLCYYMMFGLVGLFCASVRMVLDKKSKNKV